MAFILIHVDLYMLYPESHNSLSIAKSHAPILIINQPTKASLPRRTPALYPTMAPKQPSLYTHSS